MAMVAVFVHMAVLNFNRVGFAHFKNCAAEIKRFTGKRVVKVNSNFIAINSYYSSLKRVSVLILQRHYITNKQHIILCLSVNRKYIFV